ncbi:Hypothetical predicted protein [Xyrichtys novacula]|uniref:Uncharacterized protein n=1 Tax=Xyrichtys novacula TaxID=13765 RepID=A0AAV1GUN0_XYRNO|nr:Hypothetical predicted protein [Xyrichtys novacula]CAJ1076284.1 Hypothetical predicted protein [Xyrichtys novacula]CAJ1078892.1 Hypothetical predicted protein [Xyrichtys novacula]CAJ1080547.1 Hypothetical predicted protein [Xyrichtys novacula]
MSAWHLFDNREAWQSARLQSVYNEVQAKQRPRGCEPACSACRSPHEGDVLGGGSTAPYVATQRYDVTIGSTPRGGLPIQHWPSSLSNGHQRVNTSLRLRAQWQWEDSTLRL